MCHRCLIIILIHSLLDKNLCSCCSPLLLWRPNQLTRGGWLMNNYYCKKIKKIKKFKHTHTHTRIKRHAHIHMCSHLTHEVHYIRGLWLQCQCHGVPLIRATSCVACSSRTRMGFLWGEAREGCKEARGERGGG